MCKIVGITGGIGSGKSTVVNIFKENGIPIYIADDESKKILNDKETIDEIVSFFSTSILDGDRIDNKKLANIVFTDKTKLEKLNSIIHPKVKEHFKKWLEINGDKNFIVKETALLFEYGLDKECYKVITVTAPINIRVERAMKRDNVDEKSILDRIKNQLPDSDKIEKSDFVINNIILEDTIDVTKHIINILEDETRG